MHYDTLLSKQNQGHPYKHPNQSAWLLFVCLWFWTFFVVSWQEKLESPRETVPKSQIDTVIVVTV